MTKADMLTLLKLMTDETNNEVLSAYLGLAGEKITNKCYPFKDIKTVPEKYHSTQLEIACYLLNKRGAEGQTSHSENGISRSYEKASVPDSMLKDVIPFASVVGFKGDTDENT